jgi:hypothetical protein
MLLDPDQHSLTDPDPDLGQPNKCGLSGSTHWFIMLTKKAFYAMNYLFYAID